ncbi:hypothetical protein SNOUR_42905 [Streptomyces noursei ATCC 11455]|nr:hypothetical protein SNOUR_42905 [Streptomyces noursei ATCC 11455]
MGGVGALFATGTDQGGIAAVVHQPVEHQSLQAVPGQPTAEAGQHAGVEAGIGQLRPDRVLPIDRTDGHRGSLPVGQVLGELKHRDQRQHRRRHPRGTTDPEAPVNGSSAKTSAKRSRTRIARLPFGNAARATTTVCSGISGSPFTRNDIRIISPAAARQENDHQGNHLANTHCPTANCAAESRAVPKSW